MFKLNTSDPIALRYLMSETVFGIAEGAMDTSGTGQPEKEAVGKQEQVPQFVFYGKNKRNYLFLTQEKQHEWMSAAALEAFTKTIAALKLTPDDVAVLNVGALVAIPGKADVLSFFRPKVIVGLGVSVQSIGLDISPSAPMAEHHGITIFHTCTFDEMLTSPEKKRLFWTTIKTLLT
ncbi:hypothetical protein [Parapedobacter koreensis]|uniref:Uncharacterized protein n=1 Tax=Parapedobacter koreensis TaxID=332977 RepID=A0A1H7JFZ5_9SPHI|nr:hypothetical protein [Parapedobacter koreensis]SEK72335.1 hypothetical protein SAMN05421740_102519 [Parapedobacter koreensis]